MKIVDVLFAFIVLGVVLTILLTPWMDRWGATDNELRTVYPGYDLVPQPASFVNRVVTVNAKSERIYPWIV